MKKIIAMSLIILSALILTACSCKHDEVTEATCTEASICVKCEEVMQEATGHTWIDATCAKKKHCSVCGLEEGTSLGHNYGEWEVSIEATVLSSGKKKRVCSTCQLEDIRNFKLESYVKDGKFLFTPEEYRDMFFDNFVALDYPQFGGAMHNTKDGIAIVKIIDVSFNHVGTMTFVTGRNPYSYATSITDTGVEGVLLVINEEPEFIANTLMSMIKAADPSLGSSGVKDIAKTVLTEQTTHNGVTYSFAATKSGYAINIVPASIL